MRARARACERENEMKKNCMTHLSASLIQQRCRFSAKFCPQRIDRVNLMPTQVFQKCVYAIRLIYVAHFQICAILTKILIALPLSCPRTHSINLSLEKFEMPWMSPSYLSLKMLEIKNILFLFGCLIVRQAKTKVNTMQEQENDFDLLLVFLLSKHGPLAFEHIKWKMSESILNQSN